MTGSPGKVQEGIDFRRLCILKGSPDLMRCELAVVFGICVGSLNDCLDALIDKGVVKRALFQNSKSKFKYVYLLTPHVIAKRCCRPASYFHVRWMRIKR